MKDINKDIENLEEIINLINKELDKKDKNVSAILDLKDLLSLRNLIKAYKELEKENESLVRQYEYQGALIVNEYCSIQEVFELFIPKSKVKEKIEELDEDLEIMKVDAMYGRYKEYGSKLSFEKQFSYKYGMHDILQELLEKSK